MLLVFHSIVFSSPGARAIDVSFAGVAGQPGGPVLITSIRKFLEIQENCSLLSILDAYVSGCSLC
jgi:hypothetical protein